MAEGTASKLQQRSVLWLELTEQQEEAARVKREVRRNVIRERNAESVIDVNDDEVTTLPTKRRRIDTVDLTGEYI